jgi:peptidoglycan/LPS O-acetylase OafA/YrhL
MTMGSIAVDVFFVTSGFLVTASLLTRQSAIEFVWARVLRIYPALLIMLLLTVFGLGVCFTSLPLRSYLTDSGIYRYLFKCATLITGVAFDLPGVFTDNPYKSPVNGSLWTLTHEIRMYTILVMVWVALRLAKNIRLELFQLAITSSAVVASIYLAFSSSFDIYLNQHFTWLFYMFFSGAAFYVLRERIKLSLSLFALFSVVLLLSIAANRQNIFFVVYLFTIPYILFYMAYIPSGIIRKYNLLGDYSYGVYIYAFPVQQSVAALIPGVSVLSMLTISSFFTLILAVLSWNLLEKHALGLKGFYVGHTRRILGNRLRKA